jgi:hypothetical protein
MVYFQTKNPNLGKFWRALKWSGTGNERFVYGHLIYFFGYLVYFIAIGYIFPFLAYCTINNLATLELTIVVLSPGLV